MISEQTGAIAKTAMRVFIHLGQHLHHTDYTNIIIVDFSITDFWHNRKLRVHLQKGLNGEPAKNDEVSWDRAF